VKDKVPAELVNKLGIAIGQQSYGSYSQLLQSSRWRRALNAGARPQRLLFASTGTKDPKAPDILYIKALVAPLTINTMPEGTLKAFADHGELGTELRIDGGDSGKVLGEFRKADVDLGALATKLQDDGATAFVNSWNSLLGVIASKSASLARAS
jgi:transaldolase